MSYSIVETSGQPFLENVMVIVIESESDLSTLPSVSAPGSMAVLHDASVAWMKGLDGSWGRIGSAAGGLPAGGSAGQYLKKISGAYGDSTWESMDSTPTANSQKPVTSGGMKAALDAQQAMFIDMGTISSLPVTKNVTGVTSQMVAIACEFGTPSAIASTLTVTTGAGTVTLSGTLSGTTTVKLTLVNAREASAT